MPIYDVEIPGKGSFEVESPSELSNEQAYAAVLQQLNAPKPEESGDLVRGFKSYLPQTKETFGGAQTILGLGAEKLLGKDSSIAKYLTEHGLQNIKEAQAAQKPLQKESDSFTSAWEKGIGSVITDWLPYQIGQGAANILETGATALGGAAIGSVVPGIGTGAGALEGIVGKTLIKKGVKEIAEKILAEKGEDAAQAYIAKEAKKQIGFNVGLIGQAGAHGLGEVGSRAIEEAQAKGQDIHELNLSEIFPAAVVHSAADFVSNKIGLGALDGLSKPTQNMLMNVGKSVLFTGAKEVPPELLQSAAERYGAQLPLADKQAIDEYINTAAASFGMSVVPGVAGGIRSKTSPQAAPNAPLVPGQEAVPTTAQPQATPEVSQEEVLARLQQAQAQGIQGPEPLSPLEQAARVGQAAQEQRDQIIAPTADIRAAADLAIRQVEANDGVANPAQAAILDRAYPGQKMYDRVEGAQPEAVTQPSQIITEERRAPRETMRFDEQAQQEQQAAQDEGWERLRSAIQPQAEETVSEAEQFAPKAEDVIDAMQTPPALQSADQRLTLKAAEKAYSPEDLAILNATATGAEFNLTAEQKIRQKNLMAQAEPEAQPAPVTRQQLADMGANKGVLSWMEKNIVGKTQGEIAQLTDANPKLLEGNGARAKILKDIIAAPKFQLRESVPQFAPQMQQAAQNVQSELQPFLDKVGLSNIGLQLVNSINNGTADGAYFRDVIQIAMDSANPMGTLRHETIHALKELGVFTKAEWNYLSKMAKDKWIDKFIGKDKQAQYKEQYRADNNGSEAGFDAYLQEEAIAEAFREYGSNPQAGMLKRIVNKLKAFFSALGNVLRGNGFQSVEDIFSGIEAGRYAPTGEAAQAQPAMAAARYQFTNAPPSRSTKTAKEETIREQATKAVDAVMDKDARSEAWVKGRVKFIDTSAGLANVLAKGGNAVFDDGQLRADMIHHAKAQTINLVRNLSTTGLPKVNEDGTLGIERSEKTLARAQEIADSLDNNPFVQASGLSGRDMVAEVAVALRAREIQADDARRNALGLQQLAEAKAKMAQAKKLAGGNPKAFHESMLQAARLEKQGNKEAAKNLRKAAREAARGNVMVYRALLQEVRDLRREGYLNKNLKRELRTSPEKLAWADKQVANIPELNEIFDIWRTNNHAALDQQVAVGLMSQEEADTYKKNEHYIPLFKAAEDLDSERVFGGTGGTGAKSTPKRHKLEGGTHDVNVWENVQKQMARMVATAYENQTRRIAAQQLIGLGEAREVNKSYAGKDKDNVIRFRRDGRDVSVLVSDPTVVAAFQSLPVVLNPVIKFMGGLTTAFRYGALLNPMFWVKQLLRDPLHSTMVTKTETTPFHSMKNFAEIAFGKQSEAYRDLVERGIIGEVGNTMSIDDYLKSVGKSAGKKESTLGRTLHKLLKIHEASDAATRIAIYENALKKAKAQGMSEADAKSFAAMSARESINFAIQGNSAALAYARQLIPFLSASIASLDTVYRAATGHGLNAEEKRQVQKIFWSKAALFTTAVVAYSMMLQDDDDYKKVPDNIRDNNFLFPVPSPTDPSKKVFIKIPIPFEIGFLLKTLPEASIRYLSGNSTMEELGKSALHGAMKTLPGEGNPMPQVMKPIYENMTNYSFFTGRPIVSQGEQRLPVGSRGMNSSEFSKQVGGAIGVSPQMIDNLISGYFAELGTSAAGIASTMISAATGTEPPARNFESQWFVKSFMTNPNVDKAVSDYYDINTQAQQAVAAFNDMKKTGDYKALEAFTKDEENMRMVAASKSLGKIGDAMGKIRAQIRMIEKAQSISPEERRTMINQLQDQQAMLARNGVLIADQLGIR